MSFDYAKLLGRIKEIFKKQANFANEMSMSERSLSLKLNNKREWKQKEIIRACKLLNIPELEIGIYFFDYDVQGVEQN